MECCLLCLELKEDLLDYIEANSTRWQEQGMAKILEKHFWPLNSIHQPSSWICLPCWQEVDSFHKFYLRIEEAHINFGRIKIEEGSNGSRSGICQEMKDFSYCLEPEILIDQNELQLVVDVKEQSIKEEGDKSEINELTTLSNKDPLKRSVSSKSKNGKNSHTNTLITTRSEWKTGLHEIKKETTDSDKNDSENVSENDDDNSNNEPDKIHAEFTNREEGDKFIAQHFKEMFCDICDAPFENFTAVKKHFMITHSVPKGYLICCNRKFHQRNRLIDHLQCHLNPEHFKCNQCGKILSDRENLQGHMRRVHRQNLVAKHSCEICGKYFAMAYVLRTHKLTHLPKEEKKFHCTECGKFYATAYLLRIHTEVIHLKKQAKVCYICGKTLGTSTEYKAHMNKHEGIPAPVINCDVCGLRLISERSLKLHKESQHPVGGKKDHPCHLCDKISPTARALKKHINTMHEKGFYHKCTMCEKAFRRAEALKEHMASHTGTPLYKCPWCPKTFNSNGNMHTHRKNKHPKEYLELKLQSCKNRVSVYRHKAIHKGEFKKIAETKIASVDKDLTATTTKCLKAYSDMLRSK